MSSMRISVLTSLRLSVTFIDSIIIAKPPCLMAALSCEIMILKISTRRRGSRKYKIVFNRLTHLDYKPKYMTVLRVSVPETRVFSIQALAGIEENLTKFVAGQECLQFGTLNSAAVFWHEDGRLSGEGAVHLLAHMLIKVIKVNYRRMMVLDPEHPDKHPKVRDRIYRPRMDDHMTLNIVFTGCYNRKMLRKNALQISEALEEMLSHCELVRPLASTKELT